MCVCVCVCVCVCACVRARVCVCQLRAAASFTYFGQLLRCVVHIYCQYNESVHRKEQHAVGFYTIPQKISPLFTFTFAKRACQRDRRVYDWKVVTT